MDTNQDRKMLSAFALQGMLANPQSPDDFGQIVRASVAYADAMIKELDKPPANADSVADTVQHQRV